MLKLDINKRNKKIKEKEINNLSWELKYCKDSRKELEKYPQTIEYHFNEGYSRCTLEIQKRKTKMYLERFMPKKLKESYDGKSATIEIDLNDKSMITMFGKTLTKILNNLETEVYIIESEIDQIEAKLKKLNEKVSD